MLRHLTQPRHAGVLRRRIGLDVVNHLRPCLGLRFAVTDRVRAGPAALEVDDSAQNSSILLVSVRMCRFEDQGSSLNSDESFGVSRYASKNWRIRHKFC